MRHMFTLARKDLRLLFRVPSALFFAIGWPICMAVLFGLMFGGSGEPRKLPVAAVDEDRTPASRLFVSQLAARDGLDLLQTDRARATDLVRHGTRVAAVIVPAGFGAARARLFYGAPPRLELLADPSRKAEAAMLEGMLFGLSAEAMQAMMADPGAGRASIRDAMLALNASGADATPERAPLERFLGDLDLYLASRPATASAPATATPASSTPATSASAASGSAGPTAAASSATVAPAATPAPAAAAPAGWKPVEIARLDVTADRQGPHSGFDVSFVQGLVWGLIGCAMTFAISLVSERTHGTLVRLRISPLSAAQVLGGKAMACFLALMMMQSALLALGVFAFKVHVAAPLPLIVTMICAALAFVGVMMLVASLGTNEQATSGAGWALLMPMALFGGGMVPLFIMPAWMAPFSSFSIVKWTVLGFEGAIWRGFAVADFLLPWGILLAVAAAGFLLGARALQRASA